MPDLITTLRSTIEARLETARAAGGELWTYENGTFGPLVRVGEETWDRDVNGAMWMCEDELDGCPEIAREWVAEGRHIAANDPASTIRLYEGLLRIAEAHTPVEENVEWPHDATGRGTALVCPECHPAEPTDWHPAIGEAGTLPEGFVPSYVLAPCPTLRILADALGIDTGGSDG
jgi:hypothetical protein